MTDIQDHTESTAEASRLARFDAAVAQIGHRSSGRDRLWAMAGSGAMALGVVVSVVAYATSTSMSDQRDVLSAGILGIVGLTLVVAGAGVFVRFSITEFLRFWMLRLLLADDDRRDDHRDGR